MPTALLSLTKLWTLWVLSSFISF